MDMLLRKMRETIVRRMRVRFDESPNELRVLEGVGQEAAGIGKFERVGPKGLAKSMIVNHNAP